mmetsp:Transcript_86507/g.242227  ORF Transcript_86507/g.242227 Transcript_86507/m.242227 type:complete len:357 (+) Transcript_86507:444-1514(+)
MGGGGGGTELGKQAAAGGAGLSGKDSENVTLLRADMARLSPRSVVLSRLSLAARPPSRSVGGDAKSAMSKERADGSASRRSASKAAPLAVAASPSTNSAAASEVGVGNASDAAGGGARFTSFRDSPFGIDFASTWTLKVTTSPTPQPFSCEWCRKTSRPKTFLTSSHVMKPNPFSLLKDLTVPAYVVSVTSRKMFGDNANSSFLPSDSSRHGTSSSFAPSVPAAAPPPAASASAVAAAVPTSSPDVTGDDATFRSSRTSMAQGLPCRFVLRQNETAAPAVGTKAPTKHCRMYTSMSVSLQIINPYPLRGLYDFTVPLTRCSAAMGIAIAEAESQRNRHGNRLSNSTVAASAPLEPP